MMSLLGGFWRRRGPPPVSTPLPAVPPVPALQLALRSAPTFTPLPTHPATALDAAVAEAWLRYQQQHRASSWPAFLQALRTENDALAKELANITADIKGYQ